MWIEILKTAQELISSYRLRYDMYCALGYVPANRDGIEIDEHDRYAIPLGVLEDVDRPLVGTVRLVTRRRQRAYAPLVDEIVAALADPAARRRAGRTPTDLPSIDSALVSAKLSAYNADDRPVVELSRTIVTQREQGRGISRDLLEVGLRFAKTLGEPIVIGACLAEHVAMYEKYGYRVLPGTAEARNRAVGQFAHTVVCDTRSLPPARGRWARGIELSLAKVDMETERGEEARPWSVAVRR